MRARVVLALNIVRFLGGAAVMWGGAAGLSVNAFAQPEVRMAPERIEARLGEIFEVGVTCSWRPSRDGNLELVKLDPPSSALAEAVGQFQKASSDSEEGLLKIERTTVFKFKAAKSGEAVMAPARAEFRVLDKKVMPVFRESDEALLRVSGAAWPRSIWVRIAAALGLTALAAGVYLKKRRRIAPAGDWKKEVLEKIDEARRFRFEGDARRAMALLEESVRLFLWKKYGARNPAAGAAGAELPGDLIQWRREIAEFSSKVRFAGWKAPVEEQDRLLKGFEAFVKTQAD